MRSSFAAPKSSPRSPQLEKACTKAADTVQPRKKETERERGRKKTQIKRGLGDTDQSKYEDDI